VKNQKLYDKALEPVYGDRVITEGTILVPDMNNCPIPLKSTDLKANIKGMIADVEVIQTFFNDLDKKIEAIYVFPLTHNSSVHSLEIKAGDRIITGEIREREAAKQTYNKAKYDGRKAALLEEERPNLFTVSVSGIEPAQEILVKLWYYETVKYEDGEYEFVFPMTITPRYISSHVTDGERISPPVKAPDKGNNRNIRISVTLDTGFEPGKIYSPAHKLYIETIDKSVRKIELAGEGELPDRDFVLKYASKGEKIESTLFFYREKDRNGTFMLNITPKFDPGPGEIVKRELLFVLDRSGSMEGEPLEQAKIALKKALRTLRTGDIFNIIMFNHTCDILSERSLESNEANLLISDNFINSTCADGGTEILSAMKCAFSIPSSKHYLRHIVFLTDGAVGDEDFVFGEVEKNLGRARLFTFGIGSSVNRFLLEKMAKTGKGNSYFITDPREIGGTVERFTVQTSTPVLSDITIEWEGIIVSDTCPLYLPDLYSGQVLQLFGRFYSEGKGKVILKSRTGEGEFKEELEINLPGEDTSYPAIETMWAGKRIDRLLDRQRENPGEKFALRDEILGLALNYKIITPFTSLVAAEKHDGRGECKIEEVMTVKVPLMEPESSSIQELRMCDEICSRSFEAASGFSPVAETKMCEAVYSESVDVSPPDEWKMDREVTVLYKKAEKPVTVDPVSIEVGLRLLALVDPNQGAKLPERVKSLRRNVSLETGIPVPGIRFRDNLRLKPDGYVIKINGIEVAAGQVVINKFLAMGPEKDLKTLRGPRCFDPVYNLPAVWITADQRDNAEGFCSNIYEPADVIALHMAETIRSHGAELLGIDEVASLLDMPEESQNIYPDLFSLEEIHKVLQNLLSEKIPIRDLELILKTLGDYAHITKDTAILTEHVRQALCPAIKEPV